jgi:hypothetical protein
MSSSEQVRQVQQLAMVNLRMMVKHWYCDGNTALIDQASKLAGKGEFMDDGKVMGTQGRHRDMMYLLFLTGQASKLAGKGELVDDSTAMAHMPRGWVLVGGGGGSRCWVKKVSVTEKNSDAL